MTLRSKKYQVILFSDIFRKLHGKGMGVYRLANHLRMHGYKVKVIHAFNKLTDDQFLTLASKFITDETLVVGLGATVMADLENSKFFGIDESHVRHRFETLQKTYPNVKYCLGGAQATGATDDFLQRFDYFDFIIKGQGEIAFLELFNKNKTESLQILSDKDYPFNDFNISFNTFNEDDDVQEGEGLPIEIARGCIFKCQFCGYDLTGKKMGDYVKHKDILREELIRNYNEHGTTDYYVADETINDSEEKVDMLLQSVSGLPFRPTFGGFLRLDLIWKYPSMADKLRDWGLEACSFGIETINDASGKAVGKGLGRKRIDETLTMLRKVWKDDVFTNASFILGLKYDTHQTAIELDEWIHQMFIEKKLHTVFVKPLYIMPGTGISVLDKQYSEKGYRIMPIIDASFTSDRTRSVVETDCITWQTDTYDYTQASKDADYIHEKYNKMKVCKGKIGKHNFAYVKSLLPDQYKKELLNVVINDVPFTGMTVQQTEQYINDLDIAHFNKYITLLGK